MNQPIIHHYLVNTVETVRPLFDDSNKALLVKIINRAISIEIFYFILTKMNEFTGKRFEMLSILDELIHLK